MNKFKEQIGKPRKIALYAHLTMEDYFLVDEVRYSPFDANFQPLPQGELREIPRRDSVRLTKPIEVVFEAEDDNSVVGNAVQSLEAEERRLREELATKIADIRERRQQLLALTHQVES